MSNTRCEIFNWLLLPTAFVVTVSIAFKDPTIELGLAYALCLIASLAHVHYGTCVVSIFLIKKLKPNLIFKKFF